VNARQKFLNTGFHSAFFSETLDACLSELVNLPLVTSFDVSSRFQRVLHLRWNSASRDLRALTQRQPLRTAITTYENQIT
jgi:hypothetical protein